MGSSNELPPFSYFNISRYIDIYPWMKQFLRLWKDNSNVTDCFTDWGNDQSQLTRHKHNTLQKAHEYLRSSRMTTLLFICIPDVCDEFLDQGVELQ